MVSLSRAKWWLLYLLVPLVVSLMILDDDAPLTPTWREIFRIGVLLVAEALVLVWVESHPSALMGEGVDATAQRESWLNEPAAYHSQPIEGLDQDTLAAIEG
jgi:hypothetical protein